MYFACYARTFCKNSAFTYLSNAIFNNQLKAVSKACDNRSTDNLSIMPETMSESSSSRSSHSVSSSGIFSVAMVMSISSACIGAEAKDSPADIANDKLKIDNTSKAFLLLEALPVVINETFPAKLFLLMTS